MFTPSAPKPIFWKRQAIIDTYRRSKPSEQIYRTQIPVTKDERKIVCDRCAEEEAPIVGIVVMPEADKAHLYCDSCFERTPIVRRVHPEWRYFDVTGTLSIEELATALASQGLLARKS